jgi:hypothetical protein
MAKKDIPKKRKGRQPHALTAIMEKELRPYFESNKSAIYTSTKTRYGIKAINNTFKKWAQSLIYENRTEFIHEQKLAKARGIIALDQHIGKLEEHLENLETMVKDDTDNKIKLANIIKTTIKDIAQLTQMKTMIEMKPTIDVTLEEYIDKIIQEKKVQDTTEE